MIGEILTGLNFWLVVFATGAFVWFIRQILPDKIENSKVWQVILRAAPALIGSGLACIPAIRPVDGNIIQSALVGFIGGTFSQTAYGLLRQIAPEKIRSFMGSKADRNSEAP